jgi:hypothetical protein
LIVPFIVAIVVSFVNHQLSAGAASGWSGTVRSGIGFPRNCRRHASPNESTTHETSSSSFDRFQSGFGRGLNRANDLPLRKFVLCGHRDLFRWGDTRSASSLQLSGTEAREYGEFKTIDAVWTFDHRILSSLFRWVNHARQGHE